MKTARLRRYAFGAALGFAIFGAFAATLITEPLPVEAQDSELSEVRDAIGEYKRGNYRAAVEKLTNIMSSTTESGRVAAIQEEIGLRLQREFVENRLADAALRDQLQRVGLWLAAGYTSNDNLSGFSRIWRDPEMIKKFVDAYINESNPIRREERGGVIRDKYGEFAVPYIQQAYMHDENASNRQLARSLLTRIGFQAVPALIQVMRSGEALDQETAAKALGDINDGRAIPVLAEFAASSDNADVKSSCEKALISINRNAGFPSGLSPMEAWMWQAESYYRNASSGGRSSVAGSDYAGNLPVLVNAPERSYTVWRWESVSDTPGLYFEEVPLWNYADVNAEECIIRALDLADADEAGMNSDDKMAAEALLACIAVHQHTTAMERLMRGSSDEAKFIRSLLGESMVDGATYMPRTSHMLGYAESLGWKVLMAALERSLEDGYPRVSVELCNSLLRQDSDDMFEDGVAGIQPLVDAMDSEDKRIRYAAARALIGLISEHQVADATPVETTEEAPADDAAADDATDAPAEDAADESTGESTEEGTEDAPADMDGDEMGDESMSEGGTATIAQVLETAMNVFVNSLDEVSFRTVLLIAEDEAVRTKYYASLRDLRNYAVKVYDNVEDGMNEALKGTAFDYVILDWAASQKALRFWNPTPLSEDSADAAQQVDMPVKLLRSDNRTKDTPLLLIVPDSQAGRVRNSMFADFWNQGNGFTKTDSVLTYTEGVNFAEETLARSLETLAIGRTADLDRWKQSANGYIVDSCEMIQERIDPNSTVHDMNAMLSGLSSSMSKAEGRTEGAKLALAGAIKKLADFSDLDADTGRLLIEGLVARISDDLEFAGVMGASAEAIGELCRNHPALYTEGSGTFQADCFDSLVRLMRLQADDSRLQGGNNAAERARLLNATQAARNSAGRALGKMPLTAEQRTIVRHEARASRHLPLELQGNPQKDRFNEE